MNHSFVRGLVCAVLLTVAAPAEADIVNWAFGEYASIEPFGPSAIGIATGSYASQDGYLGSPAGISSTLTSPGSTLSPVTAPAGLNDVALNLSSNGSAMDVSASMQSGTTHMYASSVAFTVANGAETHLASTLQFQDMLTFTVAGGGSADIGVGFALDGNVQGDNYSMVVQENFGAGFLFWQAGAAGDTFGPITAPTDGCNTSSFTNDSVTGFNFLGSLTVTNGEAVPVLLLQQLTCENGTLCDFSQTGQMSLSLPTGVTYTSASGVFLTQQASAAPEPSLFALIGLGMAGLLGVRRRLAR